MSKRYKTLALATLSAASLLLAACDSEPSDKTVGEHVDKAIAESQQKMDEAKDAMKDAADTAQHKAEQMGDTVGDKAAKIGDAVSDKADKVGDAVGAKMEQAGQAIDDATITAAVKAKLVAADDLKALEINVDTVGGEVTLSGLAATEAARTHAEAIAADVNGVKSVHNKLALKN
ncbi:BON domain-containing protein [Cognatazoarcus halotolerans]|uniref:BON domain-containing protein n=1 Tax=Cognatazoarcus halotolerans TaxID=2686016 RepID=UPI0013596436|nr:BON domain-containing protein [Cognatazoarcus halotolerans]MBX3681072.1 BON domain-containing protein [Rhodocyclaceae bacterium]MCB1897728.1 BON domain-containing protein [Rhodocyclaceae bacterium]MCP5310722.1 BON domain-containing protein [Zoogloeaceae bacterium]